MATAQDIIKRARRLHGSIGRGETPIDAENVDDLAAFNAFMDQLWLQRFAVYRVLEETMTISTISQTIGPTGTLVTTRPVTIESAVQSLSGVDYWIDILTEQQYRSITFKTVTSNIISSLWYDPGMPDGTIYVYPVPSSAASLKLRSRQRIETFTINETISLPPGYEDMLAHNLSVILAPEYQREVADIVRIKASTTLKNIKRLNHETPTARSEFGGRYNVFSDGFGQP